MFQYIWYLMGYEEEEVKADEDTIKQRHILHKQISHNKKFKFKKMKSIQEKEMLGSFVFNPAIQVGKVLDTKKQSWSSVVKTNKYGMLDSP